MWLFPGLGIITITAFVHAVRKYVFLMYAVPILVEVQYQVYSPLLFFQIFRLVRISSIFSFDIDLCDMFSLLSKNTFLIQFRYLLLVHLCDFNFINFTGSLNCGVFDK